ncbi:hypothetical protein HRR83_006691 [Exophiala dermatitidis]|uniref:Uncharacterized protein n=1 Tax=Exophiala dermatitidis TaxID=5970 RepID=A0AAN6EU75_EXODE|nr:hypothetical protein HRR74_005851 [Exophiala dermatitidis]KAJ4515324.1 hypothetical protein HRR73_005155 [Exophiala dermatitidis]KAJ4533841.1 hypothetical protein HRR77_008325 [Exophiala dermatitidis]KAJ4540850.1 hypothetical protein HRR76_004234 [Exophiala dermatitidis]KAJ4560483.1 hypothetical protein HRR79_007891 [Exophiala dermatitidis]
MMMADPLSVCAGWSILFSVIADQRHRLVDLHISMWFAVLFFFTIILFFERRNRCKCSSTIAATRRGRWLSRPQESTQEAQKRARLFQVEADPCLSMSSGGDLANKDHFSVHANVSRLRLAVIWRAPGQ